MKQSSYPALLPVAFLLITFSASCKRDAPLKAPEDLSLLNYRVIAKTSDSIMGGVRDETITIDGKAIRIGEESRVIFTFDQQSRPVELTFKARSYNYSGTTYYLYEKNKLTVKNLNSSGGEEVLIFPLNDRGLLESSKYNTEGFAVEEGLSDYRTTNVIENGNIMRKETRDTTTGLLFSVVEYEYDLGRLNLPNVEPYKGRSSRNLVVKQTDNIYATDGQLSTSRVTNYHYTFDSSGRPAKRYSRSADTGHYEVVEFDYTVVLRKKTTA